MPREIDPPNVQREFVIAALGEGKRLDGRGILELRQIELEFGGELGGCVCTWGKTRWVLFPGGLFHDQEDYFVWDVRASLQSL